MCPLRDSLMLECVKRLSSLEYDAICCHITIFKGTCGKGVSTYAHAMVEGTLRHI